MIGTCHLWAEHDCDFLICKLAYLAFHHVLCYRAQLPLDATSLNHGILRSAFALNRQIDTTQTGADAGMKRGFNVEIKRLCFCDHASILLCMRYRNPFAT